MDKIFIIHFNPLELYPPVQNEIKNLQSYASGKNIFVISTVAANTSLAGFNSVAKNVRIIRLGKFSMQVNALKRYLNFIKFYAGSFLYMAIKRPSHVLYYETLSSFPVFLYKKFINRKAAIFIHYHEYTSLEEHHSGTRLLKFFHKHEKSLYPVAKWVSHTNEHRMAKFETDISPVQISNKKILPNYPPRDWYVQPKQLVKQPIKFVYVGALSMQTMYTREFAEWIIEQQGAALWDIYSYNIDDDVLVYLSQLKTPFIKINGAVDYDKLPAILGCYDVGVILYKGHIPNYVYNAPNKLFEYQACGLDVWFPSVMIGSLPYVTDQTYPKVIALNFTELKQLHLDAMISRKDCVFKPASFFCETVLKDLNEALAGSNG